MHFKPGDTLFREGDSSDFACHILDGRVEVVKESCGHPVVLGELKSGDYVGEMGVIEGRPRSATVRAVSEVSVEVLPGDAFLAHISNDSKAAQNMLHRLSEKIRTLSDEVARRRLADEEALSSGEAPPPPGPAHRAVALPAAPPPPHRPPASAFATPMTAGRGIRSYQKGALLGQERNMLGLVVEAMPGTDTLWIEALPFFVGRVSQPGAPMSLDPGILRLPDQPPYRLSLQHFSIERDPRLGLVVRDQGSELGTAVNGNFIGGIFTRDAECLHYGENQVVAGGQDSPFVFRVRVGG
jgi:hypothetical protein